MGYDVSAMKNVFLENIESGKEIVCTYKQDKLRMDMLGIPYSNTERVSGLRRSTLAMEEAKK